MNWLLLKVYKLPENDDAATLNGASYSAAILQAPLLQINSRGLRPDLSKQQEVQCCSPWCK